LNIWAINLPFACIVMKLNVTIPNYRRIFNNEWLNGCQAPCNICILYCCDGNMKGRSNCGGWSYGTDILLEDPDRSSTSPFDYWIVCCDSCLIGSTNNCSSDCGSSFAR
jgi:hypothetical protein